MTAEQSVPLDVFFDSYPVDIDLPIETMPTDPTTQQPRADGGENAMDDALLAAATGAVTPPQDAPIENAEDAWGALTARSRAHWGPCSRQTWFRPRRCRPRGLPSSAREIAVYLESLYSITSARRRRSSSATL